MDIWVWFVILLLIVALLVGVNMFLSPKPFYFKGSHVVVTGGSSGIGKSVAAEALKRGARVTIIARNQGRLDAAQNELKSHISDSSKQQINIASVDMMSGEQVEKAFRKVEEDHGAIDVLINCVGHAHPGVLENLPVEEIKRQMDSNFLSNALATKAVVAGMKQRRHGRIAFTSSQGGQLGIFGYTAYSASKFALRGFAEALQVELAPYGVRVTVCFPPNTDTPGLVSENLIKPAETLEMEETSPTVAPEEVAKNLLDDVTAGKFQSYVGFDGFMLCCVTAGLSPVTSVFELISQIFLSGFIRIYGVWMLYSFRNIVQKHMIKAEKKGY